MPRRRAVAREQLEELLALLVAEPELIRHWTLGVADLAAIERRRGDPNQLGFALQHCAFRYPGRCCARARSFRRQHSPLLLANFALPPGHSPSTPGVTKPGASS
jgi:TnpA family transposase